MRRAVRCWEGMYEDGDLSAVDGLVSGGLRYSNNADGLGGNRGSSRHNGCRQPDVYARSDGCADARTGADGSAGAQSHDGANHHPHAGTAPDAGRNANAGPGTYADSGSRTHGDACSHAYSPDGYSHARTRTR